MFIEMIKSEFKQLMGVFKLTLLSIAIVTGIIFLVVHFIFLILGVESIGAIVLWHLLYAIANMVLQFLYPFFSIILYVFGGDVFYRKIYSVDTLSANKLILSKFIPMVIFQITVRVALFLSTERVLVGFYALRYGDGYGISFADLVAFSEFAFMDVSNDCWTIGRFGFEIFTAKIVGIFATTLLLWLCVSIGKSIKKIGGVITIVLFTAIFVLFFGDEIIEPIIMNIIRSYPKEALETGLNEIHCHVRAMVSIVKNIVLIIIYYILSYIIVKIGLKRNKEQGKPAKELM